MGKAKRNEKIEAMEAERQRRIDALPQIQRWNLDMRMDIMEPEDDGLYVRHDDYVAATDWLLAENARLRMGDTWPEQRRGYEAEIMRQQLHIERGRGLLHRVTSTIGGKQNERDLANTRLEALNRMLIAYLAAPGAEIMVSVDDMKALDGSRVLDIKFENGIITIGTKEAPKEEPTDGENTDGATPTDAWAPMVPAPAEGDPAEHADAGVPSEPDQDLPTDL